RVLWKSRSFIRSGSKRSLAPSRVNSTTSMTLPLRPHQRLCERSVFGSFELNFPSIAISYCNNTIQNYSAFDFYANF
ncbi:hypothetical protein PFISCL1PPCAC_26701, partial [Pristionchus fissidentatus]